MASQNFNTSNKTFRQMFGNGLAYKVPIFQRDYSWTETEWDDLWTDVLLTLSAGGNASHYMGSVVLSSKDNRRFEIIDGQQRLTTFFLLLCALKHLFSGEPQRQTVSGLISTSYNDSDGETRTSLKLEGASWAGRVTGGAAAR